MWDDLEKQFSTVLSRLFPKEAQFRRRPASDDLCFSVSWKLKNDPARPNKRSRRIILVLPEELLEDYRDDDQNARAARERRMTDLVGQRLKQFDPNHNTPYGQPEPEEQWVLTCW